MKTAAEIAAAKKRDDVDETLFMPPERMPIRSMAQGLTFGFGEEIEAAIRSAIPGGPEYDEVRNELRSQLKRYQEAYPGEALTTELVGAFVPALLTGGAGVAPSAARATAGLKAPVSSRRMLAAGGLEGGLSALGYSEREGLESLYDAPGAIAAGAGISYGLGRLGPEVMDLARGLFGKRASTVVQNELQRLAEESGRSVDEIVNDIMNGRVMAENRTLQAAVAALRAKGGKAGAETTAQIEARRSVTGARAERAMEEGLTPGAADRNVQRAFYKSDDELAKLESEDYKSTFGSIPTVTPEIMGTLTDIVNRIPSVRTALNKIYTARGAGPVVVKNKETGRYEMARDLSLNDAEEVRRILRDQGGKLTRGGDFSVGSAYQDVRMQLQRQMYDTYDGLEGVVKRAESRRNRSKAYESGKNLLNKTQDEVEILFDDLAQADAAQIPALRAGVMSALRAKMQGQKMPFGKLSDEQQKYAGILRVVFPEASVDDLMRKMEAAAGSEELYNRVLFGSRTSDTLLAAKREGTKPGMALEDLGRTALGDPTPMMREVSKFVQQGLPMLNEDQRLKVVETLFSEDPDFVRKMLSDRDAFGTVVNRAANVARRLGFGSRQVATQQLAPQVGGLLNVYEGEQ